MPGLTEANYQSRCLKLDEHIAAATRAYEDQAFRAEMKLAEESAVAEAQQLMVELSNRRTALDAAWGRMKEQIAADRLKTDKGARKRAVAAVEVALKGREAAAKGIETAAKALIDAHGEYLSQSHAVVDAAVPYRLDIGGDPLHLRDAALGQFGSPDFLIAGLIEEGGIKFDGVDFDVARHRVRDEGVAAFVTKHNDIIRHLVAPIADGGE